MGALTGQVHARHPVRVAEDVGALRRAVTALAATASGAPAGHAELVATELATNLVRHATAGGYVLVRPAGTGIEMIAVDDGPGMPSAALPPPGASLPPGSVAGQAGQLGQAGPGGPASPAGPGGLGVGLAAVARLASSFDGYSGPRGTVILARVGEPGAQADGFRWGGVNIPRPGAGVSGDAWAVAAGPRLGVMMVDGLGHGPAAAAAAAAAVSAFRAAPPGDPAACLRRAHEAMRGTRGGVLAVCAIDPAGPAGGELTCVGVGNIAGQVLVDGTCQALVGRDGTVGVGLAPPQGRVVTSRWRPGAVLILASDGVRARWDLTAYRGLLAHCPAVIAATIHRDHARGTDDASVLVVADTRGQPR